MTTYTLTTSGVLKLGDAVIPFDDSTPEYQAYAAWLAQGNGPQLIDDGPSFPRIEITAWQLVQALAHFGLLEQVETAADTSTDKLVRYGWSRAPTFWSDDALVVGLATTIGVGREQLQELFEFAQSL